MIVKDLLERCPVEDVMAVLIDREDVDGERRERLCQEYGGVIEELKGQTPTPDNRHVLLGHRYLSEGKDLPDASLFVKADIAGDFQPIPELDESGGIDGLADAEVKRLLSLKFVPVSYAIDFVPWNDLLGYEIDEKNMQDAGVANLLAALLYEMTFHGFKEADMQAERDELDRRKAELDEILKLPPDEQKKHLKSADEVFEELGIVDDRSEEEKEAERMAWYREDLFNKLQAYRAVKRYWEGSQCIQPEQHHAVKRD